MYQAAGPMDRKMMRELNQNLLLNLIRIHAPISRPQLKKLSGLSLGTILGITGLLIEQQLVTEKGVAESTGGRKAELLEIAPEGRYVVGIDLREHDITGVVMNLHGNVVYTERWAAELRNNAAHAVEIITAGVEAFLSRSPVPRQKLLGIGCGLSGAVNARTGTSDDSWILGWHNVELARPLQERLHMPVFIDNEMNCRASYTKLYGVGQQYHNFLLVAIGRGLGLAVVIRDELFRGAHGIGAEFGHIPFDTEGRQCECGNQGCLEAYVSTHGIFNTYQQYRALPFMQAGEVDVSAIGELAFQVQQGDELALETFQRTGFFLGVGLSTLVNLFNPECIILNYDDGLRIEPMFEPMKATMQQHIFSQLGRDLNVIIDPQTMILHRAQGAGSLVLQDFFASPLSGNGRVEK